MRLNLSRDLTSFRDAARNAVNREVEQFRLRYLTPGTAQSMIYAEKSTEIERYNACLERGETPRPEDFPYASIEADLYGMTLDNAITFLEFYGNQWRDLAPLTELIRRRALVDIDNAKSELQIDEAKTIDWTSVMRTAA